MKLVYAILVEEVRTREDGDIDLLGAAQKHVVIDELPGWVPPRTLVLSINFDPDEAQAAHSLDVRVFGPEGTRSLPVQLDFRPVPLVPIIEAPGISQQELRIKPFQVPKAGEYVFEVSVDGTVIAKVPLAVTLKGA